MKVALKIMPSPGFYSNVLLPSSTQDERSTFRLGNAPMWPALDSCVRLSALPHATMARCWICQTQRAGSELNILSKSLARAYRVYQILLRRVMFKGTGTS